MLRFKCYFCLASC